MFTCILEPQTRIFMVQVQRAAQSNCRHQRERLLMMKLCAIFNCCVSAPNEDRVGKTARSEELRDVREMASKSQEMDNRTTEEDKGSKSLEMAAPEPVSVHHADVAKPAEKANVSTEPLRKEAPLDIFRLPLPWYRYQTRTSVKAQLVLQADKRVRLTTEVRHKLEEDRREMLIMWFIRRRAAVKRASADAKYLAAQAAEDEVEEERRRVLRGCLKRRETVREVAN